MENKSAVVAKPFFFFLASTEAFPLYWLLQALHSILVADKTVAATARDSSGKIPRPSNTGSSAWTNRFAGIDISKMLQSARVFVS
jgi:hypothetical protein